MLKIKIQKKKNKILNNKILTIYSIMEISNLPVALSILIIDYIWLKFYGNFYEDRIEKIQKEKMKIKNIPVFLTYGILFFGLSYIMKINSKPLNVYQGIQRGAIYGFITYSIFNGTNMSIFREWDEKISIVDILWGTVLNGLAGGLYFCFTK